MIYKKLNEEEKKLSAEKTEIKKIKKQNEKILKESLTAHENLMDFVKVMAEHQKEIKKQNKIKFFSSFAARILIPVFGGAIASWAFISVDKIILFGLQNLSHIQMLAGLSTIIGFIYNISMSRKKEKKEKMKNDD